MFFLFVFPIIIMMAMLLTGKLQFLKWDYLKKNVLSYMLHIFNMKIWLLYP